MRTKSGLGITNPSTGSGTIKKGEPLLPKNPTKTNINYKHYDENTLFQQFLEGRAHKIRVRLEQGLEYLALILAQFRLTC